jgi:hypothetical protein
MCEYINRSKCRPLEGIFGFLILMEDGNAYRIELGTVGWERCWGAVTWTPSNRSSLIALSITSLVRSVGNDKIVMTVIFLSVRSKIF